MENDRGFTIFIAAIVISIVLVVTLGIIDLTSRELSLSGIGKQTSVAFYNADTGLDCATYYDFVDQTPGTPNFPYPNEDSATTDGATAITCGGGDSSISDSEPIPQCSTVSNTYRCTYTYEFDSFSPSQNICTDIHITKIRDLGPLPLDPTDDILSTEIRSEGLDTCDTGANRRTKRILEYSYGGTP